ncbi:DUF6364 family protein [Spirochaeta dissipatitropha]
MNKKLTLNVDESIIDFAKKYSKVNNQSISKIFEKYLIRLKDETKDTDFSDDARELYGIINKESFPDKKVIRKSFYEKSIN